MLFRSARALQHPLLLGGAAGRDLGDVDLRGHPGGGGRNRPSCPRNPPAALGQPAALRGHLHGPGLEWPPPLGQRAERSSSLTGRHRWECQRASSWAATCRHSGSYGEGSQRPRGLPAAPTRGAKGGHVGGPHRCYGIAVDASTARPEQQDPPRWSLSFFNGLLVRSVQRGRTKSRSFLKRDLPEQSGRPP